MEEEFDASGANNEDELSLPKATVAKFIQEILPEDMSCAKETRDLVVDCCVEANEICEKEKKKTIGGDHIVKALETLGFESYIPEIKQTLEEHKKFHKEREKKVNKLDSSGLTQEELLAQQEELFAAARLRMEAQNSTNV